MSRKQVDEGSLAKMVAGLIGLVVGGVILYLLVTNAWAAMW